MADILSDEIKQATVLNRCTARADVSSMNGQLRKIIGKRDMPGLEDELNSRLNGIPSSRRAFLVRSLAETAVELLAEKKYSSERIASCLEKEVNELLDAKPEE